MKYLLVTLLVFASLSAFTQRNDTVFVKYMDLHGDGENYRTDTLFTSRPTENHFLVGTMIIPNTNNQFSAYDYGLWNAQVVGSECNSHAESDIYGPDKVVDVQMTDSTLIITCKIAANCCHDFLCDIKVSDQGVLNLLYQGYGDNCACDCCFGLTYTFDLEDYYEEVKELKGIVINGDEKTFTSIE